MSSPASPVRGRSLFGIPFVSHRLDRDYATTVLSVLSGAHSVGAGILGFFDTREARAIRLVCTEFRAAVAAVPWADTETCIMRDAGSWRASFPRAAKASIVAMQAREAAAFVQLSLALIGRGDFEGSLAAMSFGLAAQNRRSKITDADFVHFEGLHTLNMLRCNQAELTDAAFVHLKGIHTLDISGCWQAGITDAAFVHLKGIHTLNMSWCRQAGITNAAFVHLKGIHSLEMRYCGQHGITPVLRDRLRATVPNLSM